MAPKVRDYTLKKKGFSPVPEGMIDPSKLKAERFDEMKRLVLELSMLQEGKKEKIKEFNAEIEEVYKKLYSLASQDDSQFQMNLEKETETGTEESPTD